MDFAGTSLAPNRERMAFMRPSMRGWRSGLYRPMSRSPNSSDILSSIHSKLPWWAPTRISGRGGAAAATTCGFASVTRARSSASSMCSA